MMGTHLCTPIIILIAYAAIINLSIAEASNAFRTPSLFMSPSLSLNSQTITTYSAFAYAPDTVAMPSELIFTQPWNANLPSVQLVKIRKLTAELLAECQL